VVVKLSKYDYSAEVGGGLDMFLPYFKFGIELKTGIGIPNLLVRRRHALQLPIAKPALQDLGAHLHVRGVVVPRPQLLLIITARPVRTCGWWGAVNACQVPVHASTDLRAMERTVDIALPPRGGMIPCWCGKRRRGGGHPVGAVRGSRS
jgi:hypothetical protein